MYKNNCPLCESEIVCQYQGFTMGCDCSNCGSFNLATHIDGDIGKFLRINGKLNAYSRRHLIAGWMYEFNRTKNGRHFLYKAEDFEKILSDARMPKTPIQRLERFLVNLYKISDTFDSAFGTTTVDGVAGILEGRSLHPISMAYAHNISEVESMIRSLEFLGYLMHKTEGWSISPKGFERVEQLISTNINSTSVFVAMAFKDDLLDAYEKAIKSACADCGFDALIISDKHHNNGITDEIIVEIKKSKFVIVDFTYNNNGAYWEAGYAQGLGRPIIRCCKNEWFVSEGKKLRKDNPLHFDVKHYNTLLWEDHEHLIKMLKDNIRANITEAILEDLEVKPQ